MSVRGRVICYSHRRENVGEQGNGRTRVADGTRTYACVSASDEHDFASEIRYIVTCVLGLWRPELHQRFKLILERHSVDEE